MRQIWYLDDVDLFNILCPNKLAKHIQHTPPLVYHKKDFIFLPNEITKDLYLILDGKIKVGYYDDEGNEHIKIYLAKGELLGEIGFLGQHRHKDFAQAIQETTKVCKMSIEKAHELAREYTPFSLEINKRIGDNVRKLERRLEILFHKDVNRRLIELLKDLIDMYGMFLENSNTIYVEHSLTQQEIASLIGTSRKSVSVLINELERDKIIHQETGKFWVLDKGYFDLSSKKTLLDTFSKITAA
jgi:CRP-like cAMP-binding protein